MYKLQHNIILHRRGQTKELQTPIFLSAPEENTLSLPIKTASENEQAKTMTTVKVHRTTKTRKVYVSPLEDKRMIKVSMSNKSQLQKTFIEFKFKQNHQFCRKLEGHGVKRQTIGKNLFFPFH